MKLESLLRDLRFAVRSLAKSPGFVAVAVASLGIALALNTTTLKLATSRQMCRGFGSWVWPVVRSSTATCSIPTIVRPR